MHRLSSTCKLRRHTSSLLKNWQNWAFSNSCFSRLREDTNILLIASYSPHIGQCSKPVLKLVQRIYIFQRFPFLFPRQFRNNCDFSAAGNLIIRISPRWLPQRIKTTNNDGFLWCYSCFRFKLYPFYTSFKDTFCSRLRDSSGFQYGHQTKAKFRVKLALIHRMVTFSLNRCSWSRKSLEKPLVGWMCLECICLYYGCILGLERLQNTRPTLNRPSFLLTRCRSD